MSAVSGQIIFTAATANEWGADIAHAREFLNAARKLQGDGRELCLVKGTIEYQMYQSLSPRAMLLVELGKKLGGPVHGLILSTRTQDAGRKDEGGRMKDEEGRAG